MEPVPILKMNVPKLKRRSNRTPGSTLDGSTYDSAGYASDGGHYRKLRHEDITSAWREHQVHLPGDSGNSIRSIGGIHDANGGVNRPA